MPGYIEMKIFLRFFCEGKSALTDLDFNTASYFLFGTVKVTPTIQDDNLGIFCSSHYIYVNLKNCVCYMCSSKTKVNIEVCLYKLKRGYKKLSL